MTNREILINFYNENLQNNQITVIKTSNNGEYFIMVGPNLFINYSGFMEYNNDDLTTISGNYDVTEIYTKAVGAIGFTNFDKNLEHQYTFTRKVELTMQEIADKFGIPVDSLKIKK